MAKTLEFKTLTPGFSLIRATCELGDFRVWFEDDCWFWSFNYDGHSYGSEETRDEAMIACQKHYEALLLKKDAEINWTPAQFYAWLVEEAHHFRNYQEGPHYENSEATKSTMEWGKLFRDWLNDKI